MNFWFWKTWFRHKHRVNHTHCCSLEILFLSPLSVRKVWKHSQEYDFLICLYVSVSKETKIYARIYVWTKSDKTRALLYYIIWSSRFVPFWLYIVVCSVSAASFTSSAPGVSSSTNEFRLLTISMLKFCS